MSTETSLLNAKPREATGKSSHPLAAEGKLAAVVYGADIAAQPLEIERRDFERLMTHAAVGSTLVKLKIEGQDKPLDVIIKEIQPDPVKGIALHVDLWAVRMSKPIATVVPIAFEGTPEGERLGGVFLHELREIHIEALPTDIPEHVLIDISALAIGDSLHVADIVAPAGVTILTDPEALVCAVTAPAAEEEEAAETTEGAEVPEVGETEGGEE